MPDRNVVKEDVAGSPLDTVSAESAAARAELRRFGRAATVKVAIPGSALGCLSSVCTHAGGLSRVPCDPGSSAVGPMSSVTSSMSTEARMRKADRSRGQQAHTMDIISRRAWLTDQPDALAVRIPRVLPHATSSFGVPQSKPGE